MPHLTRPGAIITIRQKIVLGFGATLVILVLIAVQAYRSTQTFIQAADRVNRSHRVLELEESMLRHTMEAENAARAYLIGAEEENLRPLSEAQAKALAEYNALTRLSREHDSQIQRLARFNTALQHQFRILEAAVKNRKQGGPDAAGAALASREDRTMAAEMRNIIDEFEGFERSRLAERTQETARIARATTVATVSATVFGAILLLLACGFILRDIAARRRAEEALAEEHNLLRSVMDALTEHVFVKDVEGRYVINNAAHRKFLKVKTLSEVEGRTVFDFFPREMGETYCVGDQGVLETGQTLLNHQELALDRDGKAIWISTTKIPLRDTDGNIVGIVGVSTDISERKAAEEDLRLTATQLERSNRDLNDFASVASHDLQEPLRKILAFGDRLRSKCGPALGELGNDYLGRMSHAAERMQRLIQDLLKLSLVTSKAQPFVETDLHQVVQEVVSDLEVRIEQNGAKIEIGWLPAIEADPLQMRQLFQNLLSNALKFQRPGEQPVVSISAKVLEVLESQVPENACQIVIEDNGIGFDPKYAEKIFAVFQRLHGRLEYEGTGIGLALVRKIIDRHGGAIVAKSAEGEGATFIVTLPVKQRMKHHHDETR